MIPAGARIARCQQEILTHKKKSVCTAMHGDRMLSVSTRDFYKTRIDPFEDQRGLTSLRFLFRFPWQNFDAFDERFQKSVLNKQVYSQVATSRVLCRIANYRNKYTKYIRTPSSLPSKPSHLPPIPQVIDNAVDRYCLLYTSPSPRDRG